MPTAALLTECYHSAVSSFGERLRRQREMRGISLEEIVATTKISRRLLQALEDEQFDLLPGGIFNKSYVRAYAKCVGLSEDEAVAEYLEAARELPPDTKVIAQQHASIHSDRRPERTGFPLMPVLVLLVVAVGAAAGWKLYQEHQRERAQIVRADAPATAPAPVSAENRPPSPAPSGIRGVSSNSADSSAENPAKAADETQARNSEATPSTAPALAAASASGFEVTFRPKDRAWVAIKADGDYVVRGIIGPGAVRTVRAHSQVVFYTTNAGAVDVAFQGQDVPSTGRPHEEQTLVFNSHGLLPQVPKP